MKALPFIAMCIVAATMTMTAINANRRVDTYKNAVNSLLDTDLKNRTTIMRQQCVIDKDAEFTRQINQNLAMGKIQPIDVPDFDSCMKLEAKPILEEASASR